MALTQADRISLSKKIINIPIENAIADVISAQLAATKAAAQAKDDANKRIITDIDTLLNAYQLEIQRLDGNERVVLAETDYTDSASKKLRNPFFPNDPQTILPSIPSGVWTFFPPFAGGKAIGKKYTETYDIIQKEQDLIDAINTQITILEAYTGIGRSTGQKCTASGTCSKPQYITQPTCVANGGIWTPGPDLIASDPSIQATGTALINAVQAWKTFINATYSLIVTTDTDPTRSGQNNAAKADITNSVSIIDIWTALTDYDTNHGQTTCVGFYAYDPTLLNPTKFRAAELLPLKNEITARQSFISTRIGQLQGYLGAVTQDLANGQILTATGFYGKRFRFIDLRLNLMSGSLSGVSNTAQGQNAQTQLKASNVSAQTAYDSLLLVTPLTAPAAGTNVLHVASATGFSVSNTVYVMADDLTELTATITNIINSLVYLNINVPKNYTENNGGRIYKVL